MKKNKTCEFHCCEDDAIRHFWNHHFCNAHNWYLRRLAQKTEPNNLTEFIEFHT